MVTLEVVHQI